MSNTPDSIVTAKEYTDHHEWVSHLVLSSISALPKEQTQPVLDAAKRDKVLDVRLLINGQEFPAKPFLSRLKDSFDRRVQRAARDMAHVCMNSLMNKIQCIDDAVSAAAREAFPGIDLEEYD